jgi:hypothetical protein
MWMYADKNIIIHVLRWRMDERWVKAHNGSTWELSWHMPKYTPSKCVVLNFGFHFWCLGFIIKKIN